MPRLTAGALTDAEHLDHIVTVSAETGESITFTLTATSTGRVGTMPTVVLIGSALGVPVSLVLPHWQPVHVFTDDKSPTAKAARLAELARVGFPVPGAGA